MAKDKNLVGLSYFAVAVLGAMVFTFYWWGIGKALTALAASKQAASQSQPEVVTLLQLFKTDFTGGKDQICAELAPQTLTEFDDHNIKKGEVTIFALLCWNYAAKSKFAAFYIPSSLKTYDLCAYLDANYESLVPSGIRVDSMRPGDEVLSSKGFPFSGRIFIYHEDPLSHRQLADLGDVYLKKNLTPVFRGSAYLQGQMLSKELGESAKSKQHLAP